MADLVATRVAYGEALKELGGTNENLVVLDADLSCATMTTHFAKEYPERFFNMGIAECNMVSVASGLSEMGLVPFVSTFAIFGTGRAYEQVRNSVAYPKANVKLAMTHAGITLGEDGGSHQSVEDIALMRVIPGMTVLCPSDRGQTQKAINLAAEIKGPVYIRLARMPSPVFNDMPFRIGGSNIMRDGKDSVVFTCGLMVGVALEAAKILEKEGISLKVIDLYSIKPIDEQTIRETAQQYEKVITLEEHSVIGGLGDGVAQVLLEEGAPKLKKLGVQDVFGQSGKPDDLLKHYRLDAASVAEDIKTFLAKN